MTDTTRCARGSVGGEKRREAQTREGRDGKEGGQGARGGGAQGFSPEEKAGCVVGHVVYPEVLQRVMAVRRVG